MAQKRQLEHYCRAFQDDVKADIMEKERNNIELHAEARRFNRCLHKEREHAEMQDRIFKAKEAEVLQRCQLEQKEKLAQQLGYMKHQELKELKLRQHLRENCVELRELEMKLRRAYTQRELVAQCAEKRCSQLEARMDEKHMQETLQAAWEKDKEVELEKIKEKHMKKVEYGKELQDQLVHSEKERRRAYYEFLEDKHMIDQITAEFLADEEKLQKERCLQKKKAKEDIEAFLKEQEETRKKRKKILEEEDIRCQQFIQQKTRQEEEQRRQTKEKQFKKEEISFALGSRLFEQELKKVEFHEMVEGIAEIKKREAAEVSVRAEMEARIRRRLEIRQEIMEEARLKYARLERQANEDRLWQQQMLEKFAENSRLEQMTAQRRRLMQQEHRQAVQKLLEDRRAARAEEMQRLLLEKQREECEEAQRRKIIEEERLRMLREHATALLGYLPRGVLREDDLPHLGSEVMEKMKGMVIDPNCKPTNTDPLPKLLH